MNNLLETVKGVMLQCLNLLAVGLVLILGLGIIYIDGVFIANIANSFRMTGYLGPGVGIQIVLIILSLGWIPLFLLKTMERHGYRR